MPKKPRPPKPDGPPPLNNKDHLERANYAIQASLLLRQLGVNRAGHGDQISATSTAKTPNASNSPASVQQAQSAQSAQSEAGPSHVPIESTRMRDEQPTTVTADASRGTAPARKRRSKGGNESLGHLSRAEVTSMRKWTVHNQVKL